MMLFQLIGRQFIRFCLLLFVALSFLLSILVHPAAAYVGRPTGLRETALPSANHPIVILALDGLTYQDINKKTMPNLAKMLQTSACGLTNINTAGGRTEINSYLSTGSGTKLNGSGFAGWSGLVGETVQIPGEIYPVQFADLYKRWTGSHAAHIDTIVIPEIAAIQKANQAAHWGSHVGMLGDALHAQGFKTIAIGNADYGQQMNRLAPLFLMDSKGIVDGGDISVDLLQQDPLRPFGVKLNSGKIWSHLQKENTQKAVVLIQWGDLNRLDQVMQTLQPQQFLEIRQQILQEADQFIGRLLATRSEYGVMMITGLAPLHDPATGKERNLLPILINNSLGNTNTVTSTTTHRLGFISNFDIAPSILRWATSNQHMDPSSLGHQILLTNKPNDGQDIKMWLTRYMDDLSVVNSLRPQILSFYVHLVCIILTIIFFLYVWKSKSIRWFRGILEFIAAVPLSMLIAPIFQPHVESTYYSVLSCVELVVVGLSWLLRREIDRLLAIQTLTVCFILFDVFHRATWMKQSILGYDLIVGARYYGIGNEYMGVCLGTAMTGLVLLRYRMQQSATYTNYIVNTKWEQVLNVYTLSLGGFITYLLAAPQFGTNAGGAIAAIIGFSMLWLIWQGSSVRKSFLLATFFIAVVGTIAMVILNLFLPVEQMTHIGQAGRILLEGDFAQLEEIALRKIQLNLHLLQVSMWGTLLLITAGIVGLWVFQKKELSSSLLMLSKGYKAILGCAAAAFICNDSGVLAAAVILLFAAIGVMAVAVDSNKKETTTEYDSIKRVRLGE